MRRKKKEVETVLPFRGLDEEQVALRSRSDFDQTSSSDEKENTAIAAFAIGRRGQAMAWNGHIDFSGHSDDSVDTMRYNWASGRSSGRSHGRAAPLSSAPSVAGTNLPEDAVEAEELLNHPSLGSDPQRKSSKSEKILLKKFMTWSLENCFF